MLNPKIRVNKYLINKIQEERHKFKKSGADISKNIGKSDGWISLLENERISNITSKDLINIFKYLNSLTEEEAEKYVENFLTERRQLTKKQGIVFYDENDESFTEEGFNQIVNNITSIFRYAFKEKSEFTYKCLNQFIENLEFDIGFILGLNKISFYNLEETNQETRQDLFNEINDIFIKYKEKIQ